MKRPTLSTLYSIISLVMFATITTTLIPTPATTRSSETCTEWVTYNAASFSVDLPAENAVGLFLFDPDSDARQHLLPDYRLGYTVKWSSTGNQFLFEGLPATQTGFDFRLYLYDLATETVTQVAANRVDEFAWSSSGAYFSVQQGLVLDVYHADGTRLTQYTGAGGSWLEGTALPNDRLYLNRHYTEFVQPAVIVTLPDLAEMEFEFGVWHPNTTLAGYFRFAPEAIRISPDEQLMLLTHRETELPQPLFYDRQMPYTDMLPQTDNYPPVLTVAQRLDVPFAWTDDPTLLEAMTHPYFYLSSGHDYYIPLTDRLHTDTAFFDQVQADLQVAMLEVGTIPFFGRGGTITAIAPSPDGTQYQFTAEWYGETVFLLVNTLDRTYFDYETDFVYPIIIEDSTYAGGSEVVSSPDGTQIALVSDNDVVVYGQGTPRNLTTALRQNGILTLPEFGQILRVIGWSANSDRLLFVTGDFDATLPMSLYTIRPDGSDLRLIYDGNVQDIPFISSITWSPCKVPTP